MSEWKAKRKTMRYYDSLANIYDALYSAEQNEKFKAILNHINFKGGEKVLDVGCGTGLLFNNIKNKTELILGIDLAKNILLQAIKHAKQNDSIALVRADADYLPFKDGTFTATFAITLIQNMPNAKRTLNEIKRVTESEGVIAINGLKKKYALEYFKSILEEAKLKLIALENEENLKGYIAICKPLDKSTKHLKLADSLPKVEN
jgi:ubiquinone/menaquinone biosynthesis C-methylase UbiE